MLSNNQKETLTQEINLQRLKKRENRYKYLGLLNEYQLYGSQIKDSFGDYSDKQILMIKELIHGFGAYRDKEELFAKLSRKEKNRITINWKKARHEMNCLKQKVAHGICNQFFRTLFKNYFPDMESNARKFWTTPKVSKSVIYIYELKELGIYYDHLILHFIKCNLLPKNFFEIK